MNASADYIASGSTLRRIFPVLAWIPQYRAEWLRADLVAGVTLAAYVIPAAIGDTSLAQLPPQVGLYAALFPALVFWVFCSSRLTIVSVTSAISLLLGTSLGSLSGGDASRYAALAAATAVLVALLALGASLVKLGGILNFVSESVMAGFKTGVAFYLASTQLPKLFGFAGVHGGDFWSRMGHFFSHLHESNAAAMMTGFVALAILVIGKVFFTHRPVALLVVVGGILCASWFGLDERGVKLLGDVPQGLPRPGIPQVDLKELNELLPLALACFLLAAVETAAVGRLFSAKRGTRVDPNQEFLALAAANLASGLGRGFPVSGGMSQSLVNDSAGGRTPLSGFFAGVILLIVTVFFSGVLRDLPQPVLAAVVLVAVASLINVSLLRRLWRVARGEFIVAVSALVGVLCSGLLRGVLIGAIISLVLLLRRVAKPHIAFLGRIPGARRFSDMERHPDNLLVPGAVLVRVESDLVYFNAEHVHDTVLEHVRSAPQVPKIVICDLGTSPYVDMAGADMLNMLHDDLQEIGVGLHLVDAHSEVRDMLRTEGLENKVGRIDRFTSLEDAVNHFMRGEAGIGYNG